MPLNKNTQPYNKIIIPKNKEQKFLIKKIMQKKYLYDSKILFENFQYILT